MGKREKAGFNTPFGKLKALAKPTPAPAPVVKKVATPPPENIPDADLFRSAMSGVARLDKQPNRIEPPKRERSALPDDEQLAVLELQSLVEGKGDFRLYTETEEEHAGIAPGVSFELLDQLRKGQFSFHRHLDLHGLVRDTAKTVVERFIQEARRDGERCVLIITGRGKTSPGGIAVLRDILPRWLSRAPLKAHVLAFATAQQVDGGPGATYVLLRRPGVWPFGTP